MTKVHPWVIVAVISAGVIALVFGLLFILPFASPAKIIVLDYDIVDTQQGRTEVTGRVVNSGQIKSSPVILELIIMDDNKSPIKNTFTAPTPSILQPGQEAPFTADITDEVRDYTDTTSRTTYYVSVHVSSQ